MKERVITFRVSNSEYAQIKERAERENVTISKYITNKVLADDGLTLLKKQKVFASLSVIKDSVKTSQKKHMIEEELDEIWQLLK